MFKREKQPNQSTEFVLVDLWFMYLSKFQGWSIFMDCDMMFRGDIVRL